MSIDKCHTLSQTEDGLVDALVDQYILLYEFSEEKNKFLLETRNISFKEVIKALRSDQLLAEIDHPNALKYPHQRVYVLEIDRYIYSVPFVVKEDGTIFLKTAFKNRKWTKKYLAQGALYDEKAITKKSKSEKESAEKIFTGG